MRLTRTILGFAAAAAFTLTPAHADHGHAPAQTPTTVAGKPTATTTAKKSDHTSHAAKSTTTKSATKPSNKSLTTTSKPSKSTTDASTAKPSSTKSPKKTGTTSTTSPTGTTTPTTTMNPIAAKISKHTQLNAKVTAMLPTGADGKPMSLNDASKGFRNQGQFIAALHASQRLDCGSASCFTQLKADMVDKRMSLGQSIQDVKHTTSSTATKEAARAEHDADDDLKSTTPTTTTKSKKDSKKSEHKKSEHKEGEDDEREGDHHDRDQDDREHHEGDHHDKDHHDREHRTIAERISANQQLKMRVQALLPAGMPLKDAAAGFRSESQFLAALHASKDLGIPFAQIKAEMTGHDHDSLARAIEELKPTVNAEAAAKTAQKEASADLKATAPPHADHDDDQ